MLAVMNFFKILQTFSKKQKFPYRLIALYPDEASIKELIAYRNYLIENHNPKLITDSEIVEPGKLHLTIRYWEKKEKTSDFQYYKAIQECVSKNKNRINIITEETKVLGASISIMLDKNHLALTNLFTDIDTSIRKLGASESHYPAFIPHTALFYGNKFQEESHCYPEIFTKLRFDTLKFLEKNNIIHEFYLEGE